MTLNVDKADLSGKSWVNRQLDAILKKNWVSLILIKILRSEKIICLLFFR